MRSRILCMLALLGCSLHAGAAVRVRNFDSSILLDTNGAAVVNETITLANTRGELTRTIPLTTSGHEDTPLIVHVLKVENERGQPLKFDTERSRESLELRIQPRSDIIRLTYLVRNAARFQPDADDLLWPATDAFFALDQAQIRIALPKRAAEQFRAQAFTTSANGETVKPIWSSTGALPIEVQPVDVRTGSPGPLQPGVIISVAVVLHKGVLVEPTALTRAGWFVGANRIVYLPLVALAVMLVIRRFRPRVPRRSVVASYEPPDGLSPAEVGALIDDHVDPRDVAATLADLAVRGFIRFDALPVKAARHEGENAEPDFKITLLKPSEEWHGLAQHERTMLFHTFYGGHWTQLSSLRLRFPSIVPMFKAAITNSLRDRRFYTALPYSPWIVCQIGLWALAALLFVGQATGAVSMFEMPGTALISLAISTVIVFALGGKLSNKTRRGQRVWAEIRGFQEFLDRVDADRMQRLTPDLYEKYLPYAMALGVEQGWTAAFDGIAVAVPEWFGADGGLTDPAKFHDTLQAFVEHTLHEIKNPKGSRARLSARAARSGR